MHLIIYVYKKGWEIESDGKYSRNNSKDKTIQLFYQEELVLKSRILCCFAWWWCQYIFPKYFSIIVLKSHFLMVTTENEKKIVVSNTQLWNMYSSKSYRSVTKGVERTQRSHDISRYTCKVITGLQGYAMEDIIICKTPAEPTDDIMLCRQINHCNAMKSLVWKKQAD